MADLEIDHLSQRERFLMTMVYSAFLGYTKNQEDAARDVNYIVRSADKLEPIEPTTPQPSADAVRDYDRELIARMLETPAVFEDASRREQARLLRDAENLEADARTVVREVQNGMVLVPREPTDAMKAAGAACFPNRWGNGDATDGEDAADCYREMLSAASGEKGVG